jgi:magnesium chelatase family protein
LANTGILFLDEISEISKVALESLRQPMQDGYIRLKRRGVDMVYYSDALILAARNPCHCGLLGVEGQSCRCSAGDLERYDRKLSEALLDRFDLFCTVPNQLEWKDEQGSTYSGKAMH